jgi:hypothetical protein
MILLNSEKQCIEGGGGEEWWEGDRKEEEEEEEEEEVSLALRNTTVRTQTPLKYYTTYPKTP